MSVRTFETCGRHDLCTVISSDDGSKAQHVPAPTPQPESPNIPGGHGFIPPHSHPHNHTHPALIVAVAAIPGITAAVLVLVRLH